MTVFFAGSMYEIPAMPAADWLQVLLDPAGDVFDLFPGLCPEEEQDAINEALFEGAASLDDLGEAALQTVSAAAGRPWWVAVRLVAVAHSSWHTLGAEMLFRGVDATRLSLSGWLDVLLLTIMRNIEDDKATMFVMKLEAPLEGTDAEQKEPEMSATDFMSMA